jgi:hypothetical protein
VLPKKFVVRIFENVNFNEIDISGVFMHDKKAMHHMRKAMQHMEMMEGRHEKEMSHHKGKKEKITMHDRMEDRKNLAKARHGRK